MRGSVTVLALASGLTGAGLVFTVVTAPLADWRVPAIYLTATAIAAAQAVFSARQILCPGRQRPAPAKEKGE